MRRFDDASRVLLRLQSSWLVKLNEDEAKQALGWLGQAGAAHGAAGLARALGQHLRCVLIAPAAFFCVPCLRLAAPSRA